MSVSCEERAPLPVFIHVPKAAGHTVRALLHLNYPGRPHIDVIVRGSTSVSGLALTPSSGDPQVAYHVADVQARERELAFVATSLPYGIDAFLSRPVAYFAFLRDPVERCISYWYFTHRVAHPAWGLFESYDLNVERILSSGKAIQLSNDQVRVISGTSATEIAPEHLELAKRRIANDYLFVGAVERFEESVAELGRRLRWTHLTAEPRNVGDREDTSLLPAGARDAFEAANVYDRELHNWLCNAYLPSRISRGALAPAGAA